MAENGRDRGMMSSNTPPTIERDWFEHAFGALYPIVYAHRTAEAARPEALFAAAQVRLSAGDDLLDLCCGNGRHLVTLAPLARRAVGLDYSPELLALAGNAVGAEAELVRADMRAIPFRGAFDVVVNFFTSFGYFDTRDENLRVVRGVADALKPGGRFFIDYLSAAHVRDTLVPHSVRHTGDYEIRDTRWIDEERGRINKTTSVMLRGTPVQETGESVRLYGLDEFRGLLAEGGLRVDAVYGDHDGAPFADSRPRLIAVGRKT
jgi:SAM-dependent methyltransferase